MMMMMMMMMTTPTTRRRRRRRMMMMMAVTKMLMVFVLLVLLRVWLLLLLVAPMLEGKSGGSDGCIDLEDTGRTGRYILRFHWNDQAATSETDPRLAPTPRIQITVDWRHASTPRLSSACPTCIDLQADIH